MIKIIVPIDFSVFSGFALETAAMIAKKQDAEILALHMLEMSDAFLTTTDSEQEAKTVFFMKLAEKRFKTFLQKDYLEGVNVTPIVKHFKVFQEVADVAEDHSVDLIIMGSHGTSENSGFFTGSNTEKVVRHSEVPVLVVKSKPESVDFKNVVFVNDFKEESISPYKKAMNLFKTWNSNVQLLYVNVPNQNFMNSEEMEERVSNFLDKADDNLDRLKDINYISDYTVEKGVFKFSNKIHADLIAIPTHGRTGFSHIFQGSISEDIANHSNVPVITFRIE